jgi:hypothetical protein
MVTEIGEIGTMLAVTSNKVTPWYILQRISV